MTIETKFDLGDKAYRMHDNKAVCETVVSIRFVRSLGEKDFESVTVADHSLGTYNFPASELFKTREELLKTI